MDRKLYKGFQRQFFFDARIEDFLHDWEFFDRVQGDEDLQILLSVCLSCIAGEGYITSIPEEFENNWAKMEFLIRVSGVVRKKLSESLKRGRNTIQN